MTGSSLYGNNGNRGTYINNVTEFLLNPVSDSGQFHFALTQLRLGNQLQPGTAMEPPPVQNNNNNTINVISNAWEPSPKNNGHMWAYSLLSFVQGDSTFGLSFVGRFVPHALSHVKPSNGLYTHPTYQMVSVGGGGILTANTPSSLFTSTVSTRG